MPPKTLLVYILAILCSTSGVFYAADSSNSESDKSCFCELKGAINDCSCTVDTVDHFNNAIIYPILNSLLVKDYFRFYKVNLKQHCPFWPDDSKCTMKFCHVESCNDADIPEGLKSNHHKPGTMYSKEAQEEDCENDLDPELGFLNTSISAQAHEDFQKWAVHDEAEDDFCIVNEDEKAEYVDLLLNPERYTGYKGESAHRIWNSIYLENCFRMNNRTSPISTYIPYLDMADACLEQRAFYRLISGLHSSINIHLCSKYLLSESKNFINPCGMWGPNAKEFNRRFSPETTNNQGQHWLKNLYFLYLVELRAISKAAPYLKQETYFTGSLEDDEEVKRGVHELLNLTEKFSSHFNESSMFSSSLASKNIKTEFREKFRNISTIMDCVGCDKCRLWGKLQIQGLGTALKILFTDKFNNSSNLITNTSKSRYSAGRLKRTEIVSLFNAFGRLSNSIYELENFRNHMR